MISRKKLAIFGAAMTLALNACQTTTAARRATTSKPDQNNDNNGAHYNPVHLSFNLETGGRNVGISQAPAKPTKGRKRHPAADTTVPKDTTVPALPTEPPQTTVTRHVSNNNNDANGNPDTRDLAKGLCEAAAHPWDSIVGSLKTIAGSIRGDADNKKPAPQKTPAP